MIDVKYQEETKGDNIIPLHIKKKLADLKNHQDVINPIQLNIISGKKNIF